MKVIVTGATGLVGSAVVRQCIASEEITHAFVLTRKPLPETVTASPKVTVITHDDFSSYPSDLLQKLAGAEACIWYLRPPFLFPRVPEPGSFFMGLADSGKQDYWGTSGAVPGRRVVQEGERRVHPRCCKRFLVSPGTAATNR